MSMFNFLSYGFMQRAVIAGSFIAALCAVLGVFLVLRRLSLIGDGLAHVTFGSLAIGLFFNTTPLYVALPLVVLSSLGIMKLTEAQHIFGDAAIGIVSALGIAIGVLLVSVTKGFNIDLFSYLFGNILAISKTEVAMSIALSAAVIIVVALFYQDLVAVTFDEECAQAEGINTKAVNKALVILTAVTVMLAMKVVGIMLVSALLILPTVTALQIAKGFKMTILVAVIAAVVSVWIGIMLSFFLDWPSGATIVLVSFVLLVCAFSYRKIR
ncbi:MAG: metal ABC transporter permease [Elusimicrobia bacterium]|nr:metal ABC transporter permease [Elusimicrobiota bacterium]